MYKALPNATPLSIHTFGFGDNYDNDVMRGLSNLSDGNFYYVEN